METVSQETLVETLSNAPQSASFVSFESVTEPRLLKTDNPYYDSETKTWNLRKISRTTGIINFVYENSVNNQREREGLEADFESHPRRWGSRVDGTPLVEHKGRFYLEVNVQSSESRYVDNMGREVPREELEEFFGSRSSSSRQGVEDKVILRDYKISSINQINMFGQQYDVIRVDQNIQIG